jgi:hypothetical protein
LNKIHEQFFLTAFFESTKLFRSARITASERPDFIVESEGKRVGIEITQYYQGAAAKGSRLKESEVIWNDILEVVSERSTCCGLDHFTGLLFTTERAPKRAERTKLIEELLTIAQMAKSVRSKEPIELKPDDLRRFGLSQYVRKVFLIGTRSARAVKWERANSMAGSVGFSEGELTQILKSKRKRGSGYDRTRFEEMWLLIVATGTSLASTGAILKSPVKALADANRLALSKAGFDQIWYFSYLPEFSVRMFP